MMGLLSKIFGNKETAGKWGGVLEKMKAIGEMGMLEASSSAMDKIQQLLASPAMTLAEKIAAMLIQDTVAQVAKLTKDVLELTEHESVKRVIQLIGEDLNIIILGADGLVKVLDAGSKVIDKMIPHQLTLEKTANNLEKITAAGDKFNEILDKIVAIIDKYNLTGDKQGYTYKPPGNPSDPGLPYQPPGGGGGFQEF